MTEHCTGLRTLFRESASDTPTRLPHHLTCTKARPGTTPRKTNCRKIQHHADDLDARAEDHHGSHAAAIMRAVNQQGIGWRVVRTWEGTRDTERQIKLLRARNRLCPECTPNPLSAAAAIARAEEIRLAREAAREAARPLPRNRDGSLSRSRTTDTQKQAAGVMTAAQQAQHTTLRRGLVTGKHARPAERGPLDIDPWAAPRPRQPEREHELEAS